MGNAETESESEVEDSGAYSSIVRMTLPLHCLRGKK